MADKQDASQDFNPKHRVVGAIILVVLAVIVVPLILRDHAPLAPIPPTAETPAPDTRVVVTPLTPVPLPDNSPPTTIKTIPSLVAPATLAAASKSATAEAAPSTQTAAAPADVSATPLPSKATTKSSPPPKVALAKGWIVQVGAFSHSNNAARLKENLARHGYTPELDKISINHGQGVRVRVGPYAREAEARTVQVRIQHELGIKGVVRAYP